jgi:hypothetical protein
MNSITELNIMPYIQNKTLSFADRCLKKIVLASLPEIIFEKANSKKKILTFLNSKVMMPVMSATQVSKNRIILVYQLRSQYVIRLCKVSGPIVG